MSKPTDDDMDMDGENFIFSEEMKNRLSDIADEQDTEATEECEAEKAAHAAYIESALKFYPLGLTKEECLVMGRDPSRYSEWYNHVLISRNSGTKIHSTYTYGTPPPVSEVAEGTAQCHWCKGDGYKTVILVGVKTNFYFEDTQECECAMFKFANRLYRAKVAPILWGFKLSALSPCPDLSLPPSRQREEYQFLRNNISEPDKNKPEQVNRGFMWYGPSGTGKSTMAATALRVGINTRLRELYKWGSHMETDQLADLKGVWNIDGQGFFESEQGFSTSKDKDKFKRLITVQEIEDVRRKRGISPFVLIEELDKRGLTDFTANSLFTLVNSIEKMGGRLLITTNFTPKQFEDMFLQHESQRVRSTGEALLRRLKKICHQRDLFKK